MLGILSGAVAGLGTITPAAGFVEPWSAMLIGLSAGAVCYWASVVLKNKLGYDDSLDVFGVHGVGGILGTILTGVFATRVINDVAKGQAVILLEQGGGPSHMDTFDLKPDAPDDFRGEFKPIDTKAPGVQISQHLPKMASVMDRAAIVRSLYHTIPSHGPATVFMTTAHKPTMGPFDRVQDTTQHHGGKHNHNDADDDADATVNQSR